MKDDGNTRKVNVSDVEQVEKLLTENQVEYRLSDVPKDSMLTTVVVPMLITLGGVFLIFFLMSRQNGGEFKGNELWKEPRKDEHEE